MCENENEQTHTHTHTHQNLNWNINTVESLQNEMKWATTKITDKHSLHTHSECENEWI